ncbi:MAG: hypothetical protein QXI60_08965, partial [Thermofilaceae archaeon]
VLDAWTGEVNQFVWNSEGTLARWWSSEPNSYARVFSYDEEGRLTKIERDYGDGNLQVAYEYGYTGNGVRVWKRDYLNQQEYRYLCRIGCGGVPMRVYNRAVGGASWASVEDYLPAGNALGYGWNWRFSYSGGELLMMGATGEPSGYYPTDSNGVWVQSELPAPCVCPVVDPQAPMVCPPLGYGNCGGGECPPPTSPPAPFPLPAPPPQPDPEPIYELYDIQPLQMPWNFRYGEYCGMGHGAGDERKKGLPDPIPIDALDRCCQKHDEDYDRYNCSHPCLYFTPLCKLLDCKLANCARKVDCKKEYPSDPAKRKECELARAKIIAFMMARCARVGAFP